MRWNDEILKNFMDHVFIMVFISIHLEIPIKILLTEMRKGVC